MASQITPLPTPVPTVADPTNFDTRADIFLAALPAFATQTNQVASEVNQAAQAVAGSYSTYTGSITVATGSDLNITIQTGKLFVVGQPVTVYEVATPIVRWMSGIMTAYNSGSGACTITRTASGGSGANTNWIVAASAPVLAPSWVGSVLFLEANYGVF